LLSIQRPLKLCQAGERVKQACGTGGHDAFGHISSTAGIPHAAQPEPALAERIDINSAAAESGAAQRIFPLRGAFSARSAVIDQLLSPLMDLPLSARPSLHWDSS
jgi:hypothetical protein